MSQSGLNNSLTALNLRQQTMQIWHYFVVNITKVIGDNSAEQ
jgi:hypothetical protein